MSGGGNNSPLASITGLWAADMCAVLALAADSATAPVDKHASWAYCTRKATESGRKANRRRSMKKKLVMMVLLVALMLMVLAPAALAIVDPVTPIGCEGTANPAKVASGGAAGGAAAIPVVVANPSNGPAFPAQGRNSSLCP